VYAATSEEFVAQMLNLDVLRCYASTRVATPARSDRAWLTTAAALKRAYAAVISRDALSLAPAIPANSRGRASSVRATQLADGRCDFLAVAPLLGSDK